MPNGKRASLEWTSCHYLRDGSVAGTVILFEDGGITEDRVPELLQYNDEALLPEVSLDEHNLSFTVVRGRVLGDFRPELQAGSAGAAGAATWSLSSSLRHPSLVLPGDPL